MAYDLVIRHGLMVDGTGRPAVEADVAVEADRIAAIGKNLGAGHEEIDARGKVVAPGFIDPHTHMDQFAVLYPNGQPVVQFGVTTVVTGDCGGSVAPVPAGGEPLRVLMTYLHRVLDDYVDEKVWQWETIPEYLNYLKGKVGINFATLAAHSPIRLSVMGEDYQREARPDELDAMKRLLREALEAGVAGFSTAPKGAAAAHAATPSTFASDDETVELANLAGRYGGLFQFNGFLPQVVVPETGHAALLDRITCTSIGNEFRIIPERNAQAYQALAWLDEQTRRGKDVIGVFIPYRYTQRFDVERAFIFDGLPTWEEARGSREELKRKLADPEFRRRLEAERVAGAGSPRFREWWGWDDVVVHVVQRGELKEMEGESIGAVARRTGQASVDVFFDLWLADDLASSFNYWGAQNGNPALFEKVLKHPQVLFGTDAGAHLSQFYWHGSPAYVLGHHWRETGLFTLEEAVNKITALPASKLGINRGQLKYGWPADITVFDPDRIMDCTSHRIPDRMDDTEIRRQPTGINAVLVNGQVVLREREFMNVFPGKVTRQELSPPVPY